MTVQGFTNQARPPVFETNFCTMQQTTINLPSTHPVRALTGLARQIALPSEFAPERFPSFPALERTAVMGFTQPTTLPLSNAKGASQVMVTRQASFPVWGEILGGTTAYQATWSMELIHNSTTNANISTTALIDWSFDNRLATVNYPGVAGALSYGRPYIPLAVDAGTGRIPFMYVPANAYAYWTFGSTVAVTQGINFRMELEVWSSPGEVNVVPLPAATIATGNLSVAITNNSVTGSGIWVRPYYVSLQDGPASLITTPNVTLTVCMGATLVHTPSTTTQGSFLVTVVSPAYCFFPLVFPSEFVNSSLPWYSTRLTAVAALFTNVTQVLNKSGTILAGRIAPQVLSPWLVTSAYVNALHPSEKAFLPLETGFYTYAPPSTDMADFWDYTLPTGGSSSSAVSPRSAPLYRLDNSSLVNIAYFTPGGADESLAVTASWHIEFRTSSALFQIALSGMQLETLHQSQLALARAGFFFENPTHSAILQKIIAAARAVAPYAAAALSIAFPAAGRVATALAGRQQKDRKKKRNKIVDGKRAVPVKSGKLVMPPTSAAKSGITSTPKKKGGLAMFLAKNPQYNRRK